MAIGDGVADVSVVIDAEVSPQSLDAIPENIRRAMEGAASVLTEELTATLRKFGQQFSTTFGKTGSVIRDARGEAQSYGTALTHAQRNTLDFTRSLQRQTSAIEVQAAALKQLTATINAERAAGNRTSEERQRQEISARIASDRTRQMELADTTAHYRQMRVQENNAGQLAVVQARNAGKQRIQIARSVLETIGRMERGIGATIAGTARTAVGAAGKLWDGIIATTRHGTQTTENITNASNREINQSIRSSLTLREAGVRRYYSAEQRLARSNAHIQETIARQSSSRTALLAREAQARAQTGLTGVASRAGLIGGGILAGIGVGAAARSTYNIGSEFTRGLAVLQAQLGLTGDQMEEVHQLSIDLGNDLSLPGVSALEAAQSIQVLAKQFGYLGEGAVVAAEAAAKGTLQLARATSSSAEDAAGIIGSAVNVFKIGADQAITVADQVTGAISKAAGVSFSDFRDAFVLGASAFQSFVGPAESATDTLLDFNASLAVLARSGLTGQTAGAGLKTFFISASKQTDAAKAAIEGLVATAHESGSLFFDAAGKARTWSDSLDILRKGLVGMTDAEKNATLVTLFGNRGFTIANALVATSSEEYEKLRDSIRTQGLAAQIAAAQNTGLKGALDALKSVAETVQILFYEQVSPALGKVVLSLADLTSKLLFAGGGFATFRTAAIGAGIALGGLLAAKAAGEAIQFLGLALRAALSPLGLLISSFALAGAAIALLMRHSEPFRDAMGALGDKLREVGGRAAEVLRAGLESVGGFITGTVIPAVTQLGDYVGDHLMGAFEKVSDVISTSVIPTMVRWAGIVKRDLIGAWKIVSAFILDTALPAVTKFAGVLRDEVLPVVSDVASTIGKGLSSAVDAVVRFGQQALPVIQPVIDGFIALGKAIGDLSAGSFTQVLGGAGLGAMLGGLPGAVVGGAAALLAQSGIWDKAFEALRPVAHKALEIIRSVFSEANLRSAMSGVLDAVEWVGRMLGTIVSSPQFLAAIAAIAAAAVVVAARFVEGFIKGVLDSDLWGILGNALMDNLGKVFTAALVGGGALLAVRNLRAGFERLGVDAGGGFLSGLRSTLVGGVTGARGFLSGLSGRAPDVAQGRALDVLATQARDLQNQFRILGSPRAVLVSPESVRSAEAALGRLRQGFTDAEVAGLKMRDRIGAAMTGVGAAITGARGIGGGLRQFGEAFKTLGADLSKALFMSLDGTAAGTSAAGIGKRFSWAFSLGFKEIGRSWSTMMGTLRDIAESQSSSIGKVLGQGIVAGVKVGAVGFAAFQGGRMAGQAGVGGLEALLGGAVLGGTLGGPLGAVAGGGAALIGQMLGDASRKAKEAKEAFQALAAALDSDLKSALDVGADGFVTYGEAIKGASVQAQILADFKKDIPTLLDVGVGEKGLLDVFSGGQQAVDDFVAYLKSQMGDIETHVTPFRTTELLSGRQEEIADTIDQVTESFKRYAAVLEEVNQAEAFRTRGAFNAVPAFSGRAEFEEAGRSRGAFDAAPRFSSKADFDDAGLSYWDRYAAASKAAYLATQRAAQDAAQKASSHWGTYAQRQKEVWLEERDGVRATKAAVAELSTAYTTLGVSPPPVATDLETLNILADDAKLAVDDLNTALDQAFRVRGTTDLSDTIDQGILAARGRFASEQPGDAIQISFAQDFAGAEMRQALQAFNNDVKAAVAKAISEGAATGLVPDAASLAAVTDSLLQANLAAVENPYLQQIIKDEYAAGIAAGAEAAQAAQATAIATAAEVPVLDIPVATVGPENLEIDQAGINQAVAEITAGLPTDWLSLQTETIGPENITIDQMGISNAVAAAGAEISSGWLDLPPVTIDDEFVVVDIAAIGADITNATAGLPTDWLGLETETVGPENITVDQVGINGALTSASDGIPTQWLDVPTQAIGPTSVTVDVLGIGSKLFTGGLAAGRQLAAGIGAGVIANAATAAAAAATMAAQTAAAARAALKIFSPSRVFMEIGNFIGQGLALGIEDSTADVEAAMTESVGSAVEAAIEAMKGGTSAMRSAGVGLFKASIGSGAIGAPGGGFGGPIFTTAQWTEALAGFGDAVSQAINAAVEKAKEDKTKLDLGPIFDLSPGSLSGATNISTFVGLIDEIAGIGEKMLGAGVDAGTVAGYVEELRNQLVTTAGSLGFNVEQVVALADALGLSGQNLSDFAEAVKNTTEQTAAAAAMEKQMAAQRAAQAEAERFAPLHIEGLTFDAADLAGFAAATKLSPEQVQAIRTDQAQIATVLTDAGLEEWGRAYGMFGSELTAWIEDMKKWQVLIGTRVDVEDAQRKAEEFAPRHIQGLTFGEADLTGFANAMRLTPEQIQAIRTDQAQIANVMTDAGLEEWGRAYGMFGSELTAWIEDMKQWQVRIGTRIDPQEAARQSKIFHDAILDGLQFTGKDQEMYFETAQLSNEQRAKLRADQDQILNALSDTALEQWGRAYGLFGNDLKAWIEDMKKWQIEMGKRPDTEGEKEAAKKMKDQVRDALLLSPADLRTYREVYELPEGWITEMQGHQAALLNYTDQQIEDFGRSFGLYADSLASFMDSVKKWQIEQGKRPDPDAPPEGTLQKPNIEFINHLYLPYGDPDAVALAVVNRQATTARLPGF